MGGARWAGTAGLVVIAAVTVVLGAARWTGEVPFGSDNDEYRLVAEQLLGFDAPVIAGVEGTKYPLGYPAVLAALDAVGLPMVDAALALNVALVGVAAALTAVAARHRGPAAVVVAAGVVLLSRPLWAATQSTMPDVALVAVVAAALAADARLRPASRARLAVLTGAALVATALKSVGVLVGIAASVALLRTRRVARLRALAPVAAAVGLSGLTAAVMTRYPEHTTGYARTFFLEDPYDAAGGDAPLVELVGRLTTRADLVADDAARAVWGDLVHGWPAWLLTGALVAAGVLGARRRTFVGTFVACDLAFLALWPYSSVRFGLPLVPVAALGAATLVSLAAERLAIDRRVAVAAVGLAAAVVAVDAVGDFDRAAEREAAFHRDLGAARDGVVEWLQANAPDAVLVSPDYREIAIALRRPVHPLPYTSDAGALLAEAERADLLVRFRGVYGERETLMATLLDAHGDRFEVVHATDRVEILRVVG